MHRLLAKPAGVVEGRRKPGQIHALVGENGAGKLSFDGMRLQESKGNAELM